jgi:HSP20 family protein
MSELTLWKKQEMGKLRRDLARVFRRIGSDFGVPVSFLEVAELFPVELSETESSVVLKAELPGMKPENFDMSVTEDSLTLKGESREERVEESDRYQRVEQRSRSFSRTVALPCRIVPDDVKATYKDGILRIVLPKCKPKKARVITIEGA